MIQRMATTHLMRPALQTAALIGVKRKNVSLWREHNRRRWQLEKDALGRDDRSPFVCECTNPDCFAAVSLTMDEFDAAHMCPSWFAVLPEHTERCDGKYVLLRQPHFWVVELVAA